MALPSGLVGGGANLVPCVTNASLSLSATPTSGGGGGGGSVGPDLTLSTITINPLGQITFANDASLDSSGLAFDIDAAGTSTLNFGISYLNDESGSSSNIGLGNLLIVSAGDSFQNLGANKLFLNSGYGSTPGAIIMNDPINPGTAYVSSLRVSSINGQTPGGGIYPEDLVVNSVSTILINASTINCANLYPAPGFKSPVVQQGAMTIPAQGFVNVNLDYDYGSNYYTPLATYSGNLFATPVSSISVSTIGGAQFQLAGHPGCNVNWVTFGN